MESISSCLLNASFIQTLGWVGWVFHFVLLKGETMKINSAQWIHGMENIFGHKKEETKPEKNKELGHFFLEEDWMESQNKHFQGNAKSISDLWKKITWRCECLTMKVVITKVASEVSLTRVLWLGFCRPCHF